MKQYGPSITGDDVSNEAGFFDTAFGLGRDKILRGSTAVLEDIF